MKILSIWISWEVMCNKHSQHELASNCILVSIMERPLWCPYILKIQCSRTMVQELPQWSSAYNWISNAGSIDSNPGQETKVPHAMDRAAKNQRKKERKEPGLGHWKLSLLKRLEIIEIWWGCLMQFHQSRKSSKELDWQ